MELGISRNCGTLELGRCQGKNFNSTPKKTSNTGLNTMTEKEQVSTALSELKKMVMYEEFGQNWGPLCWVGFGSLGFTQLMYEGFNQKPRSTMVSGFWDLRAYYPDNFWVCTYKDFSPYLELSDFGLVAF